MTAPIGVFDSGVGGLSVLRDIRRELPAEDLIYVADSGYAPYGDRPPTYVQERAIAIVEFLLSQGAKAVVGGQHGAGAISSQADVQGGVLLALGHGHQPGSQLVEVTGSEAPLGPNAVAGRPQKGN